MVDYSVQIAISILSVLFSDVDECQTEINNCRYACKNLVGSFMCICPEGYTQVLPITRNQNFSLIYLGKNTI